MSHAHEHLDYELLREDPARRGPIPLATLQQAARLIDGRPMELIEEWDATDHPRTRGGRPSHMTMRAVLIVWLAVAMEEQRLFLTNIATAFGERLTRTTAEFLGLPADNHASIDEWYERARRATNRLLGLIDAFPLENRQRRLTKLEWDEELRRRVEAGERLAEKYRPADQLMNAIVARTYAFLPQHARTKAVSLCIDATPVPLYARGISRSRLPHLRPDDTISIEPDAGFYVRETDDHSDDGKKTYTKVKYAFELEISVLSSNDANQPNAVPHIVLGVGHHAPGFGPGQAARNLFEQVLANGFEFEHVTGDRAYFPGAKPEVLQNFLRENRAKIIMDYKSDDFAKMDSYKGARQIDGNWYSPSIPAVLANATLTMQTEIAALSNTLSAAERDTATTEIKEIWRRRIAERARYLLRRKERPDATGAAPWMCPAFGPSATLLCEHKPTPRLPAGALPLRVLNAPTAPEPICTNKSSMTIPGHAGGKYAQEYQYGTDLWRRHYNLGRTSIESFNDYMKNPSQYSLAEPGRRRLRGRTAQFFLSTLVVIASNLAKIRDFINDGDIEADEIANGKTAPEARSRRSRRSNSSQRRRDHFSRTGKRSTARRLT